MEAIVLQAQELKSSVEVGQKSEFEKVLASLATFVEEKIVEAKALADLSSEELLIIEKNVFDLSDAKAIESDPELAAARSRVLSRLQNIGTQLHDEVTIRCAVR